MHKRILAVFIAALALPFAIQPGMADDHRGGPGREHQGGFAQEHRGGDHFNNNRRDGHPVFRGDIRRFREHDIGVWHGGHWFHGPHGGRRGWWWTVGGIWYFYPAPVYPYPDPYLPPLAEGPPPASADSWYYCNDPPGYYPYVAECRTQWQPVSPNAPPPPPPQ